MKSLIENPFDFILIKDKYFCHFEKFKMNETLYFKFEIKNYNEFNENSQIIVNFYNIKGKVLDSHIIKNSEGKFIFMNKKENNEKFNKFLYKTVKICILSNNSHNVRFVLDYEDINLEKKIIPDKNDDKILFKTFKDSSFKLAGLNQNIKKISRKLDRNIDKLEEEEEDNILGYLLIEIIFIFFIILLEILIIKKSLKRSIINLN